MVGRPLAQMFRVINEETRQPVERSLEQALDEGRVIDRTRHSILIRRDESEIAIDDSVAPIRGAKAEVTGGVLVFRDVQERRRLEREAETARRRAEEKRAELSALFSAAPVAITVLRGPDHVIELANARVCQVWGRTEAQVVGKPLLEALPEVAGQGLEELLAGVLRTGIPYVGTEQLIRLARRKGGALEDVYFTFVYQPMKDALGKVESVLVVASEVTESVDARRRIEELASMAREREERLRLALEASRSGAWEVDLETQQIEADAIVRDLFGLGPTELFTVQDALERMPADDAARVAERLATAVAPVGGGGYSAQFRVADRAGQLRWIDSRGQVTFGSDGRPRRFLGTLVDVTNRKNAESMREALLNSERSAREVSERQREFEQYLVGIVSHDLRSPLSAIAMGAEILQTAGITEERSQQAVGGIRRSVDRALHLIRDVLDFTQARLGGGLEFNPRAINLGEVARDAIDEIRLSAPARDVVLQVDEPASVNGAWDPDRLFQVIFNLVSNALKYSAGEAPVTVLVRGGAEAVEIAVHNFGPPIAAALVPQLFLPMRRAAGAGANVERSVGLGLYIVDHIAQLHGGRVDVSSTERDGTTFRVCLPRTSG